MSSGQVSYLNLGTGEEKKIKITICHGPSGPDREVIKKLRLSILMDVISAGCERASGCRYSVTARGELYQSIKWGLPCGMSTWNEIV